MGLCGTLIDLILLAGCSACVIAGSAIFWHVEKKAADFPGRADQRAYQYDSLHFVFALVAAWLVFIWEKMNWNGKSAWTALFYGLFISTICESNLSFSVLDRLKIAYKLGVAYTDGFLFNFPPSDVTLLLRGLIVNYIGLIVALIVVHGEWQFKCSMATFVYIGSVALAVVGTIILYRLETEAFSFGQGDRNITFGIVQPMWACLVVLGGAVLHKRKEAAYVALAYLGITGVWFLTQSFIYKFSIQSSASSLSATDIPKMWAGSLLCWASSWAMILCGVFAVYTLNEDADIKTSEGACSFIGSLLDAIFIIGATAASIAGTANLWYVFRNNVTVSGGNTAFSGTFISAFKYEAISFIIAIIAAWMTLLARKFSPKSQGGWAALFFGLVFYNAVVSDWSIQNLDRVRTADRDGLDYYSPDHSNDPSNTIIFTIISNKTAIHKFYAGILLNYIGLFFAFLAVVGGFSLKCSASTFVYLFAVAAAVCGSIIVWNTDAAHAVQNATPSQSVRPVTFNISVGMLAIVSILAGSIFFGKSESAHVALALLGIYGLWVFEIESVIAWFLQDIAVSTATQAAKFAAGGIILWGSAWISVLTGALVLRNPEGIEG